MSIVCATDFSEPSASAVEAAARLAARMNVPLHLVHSLEVNFDQMQGAPRTGLEQWAEARLGRKADALQRTVREVHVHVTAGPPDDEVVQLAERLSASLIVVAALGNRPRSLWQLGSHADRIAQRSRIPVLIVRDAAPFDAWVQEHRPLRIALAADRSTSSELAARWIGELARFGLCEVVAIHLYWPPHEFHRLGLDGVRDYATPDPVVTETLERELRDRFAALASSTPVRLRLEPHVGRRAERIAELALEEKADLLVVGSHMRTAIARLWEGSVSRGVLQASACSVVCVPAGTLAPLAPTPRVQSVLVATDFSTTGNAAVALAYAIVNRGGTVHLAHVMNGPRDALAPHDVLKPASPDPSAAEAIGRLHALLPSDAAEHAKTTRVHLLEAADAATGICQAAERLNADVICLGTHGRSALGKVLLGSVAEAVMQQTRRPVLFARRVKE